MYSPSRITRRKGAIRITAKCPPNIIFYIVYYIYVVYEYHTNIYYINWGQAVAVDWDTALQAGMSRVPFPMLSLEFFIDFIFSAALCSWDRLSIQEILLPCIFPVGKGVQCVEMTILPRSYGYCLEIWEPQTPGNLQGLYLFYILYISLRA